MPIGRAIDSQFNGHYDGNNFEISGLTIGQNEIRLGLFGYVIKGEIKNIVLKNPQIKNGLDPVGGIVGGVDNSTISNCHIKGGLIQGDRYVGGILGGGIGNKIYNCSNSATVSGRYGIGGINGWHTESDQVEIRDCINYGNIEGSEYCIGGIVGLLPNGKIDNCFNYGKIKGQFQVGGIAGRFGGELNNCIVDCTLEETGTSGRHIGGVVGVAGPEYETTITNCAVEANISTVLSEIGRAGTITGGGYNENVIVTISNCSFYGSSTMETINFAGDWWDCVINIDNCYAIINQDKYYSTGDFAGFALEAKFNKGLPAQRSLYWAASVAPAFDKEWFTLNGFRKAA